jgi:hypothetical protein
MLIVHVSSQLPVLNPRRAVSWSNEKFTRLIIAQAIKPTLNLADQYSLCVLNEPVKRTYGNKEEYKNVMSSLLFEDWKTHSSAFKKNNQVTGEILSYTIIHLIKKKKPPHDELLAIRIKVPNTKTWTKDNPCSITYVNFDYQFEQVFKFL